MAGGQCEVLIAIQHSPFIIDNIESCLEIGQLFDGQVRWQHILIDSPWFGLFSEHKSRTGDGVNQRNRSEERRVGKECKSRGGGVGERAKRREGGRRWRADA